MIDTVYQDKQPLTKKLFEKLVIKAKEKAEMIASLSDIKLGRIVELKEVKEIDNVNINLMELFIKSQSRSGWGTILYGDSKGIYSKAVVIKFEGT